MVATVEGGVQGWVMEKAMGGVEHPILQDQHQEITDSQIPPGVGISSAVQPGNAMGLQPQHRCGRQGKHHCREHRQANVMADPVTDLLALSLTGPCFGVGPADTYKPPTSAGGKEIAGQNDQK